MIEVGMKVGMSLNEFLGKFNFRKEKRGFIGIEREHFLIDSEIGRNCWYLIRISIQGTVELRMFDVTEDIEEIISWVSVLQLILRRKD